MPNHFVTAGHRFGDSRVLNRTLRPFKSPAEMREVYIEAWNKKVRASDLVYYLGNMFYREKTPLEILKRLNGQIVYVLGSHEPLNARQRKRFLTVVQYREIKACGQKVILFHWPLDNWQGREYGTFHFHAQQGLGNKAPLSAWHRMNVTIDYAEDHAPFSVEEAINL